MGAIDSLVVACAGQEDEDEGDWVDRLAGRWRLLFSTEAGLTALMGGGVPLVSAADVYQLVESGGRLKVSRCFIPQEPVQEDDTAVCDGESSECSYVLDVVRRVSDSYERFSHRDTAATHAHDLRLVSCLTVVAALFFFFGTNFSPSPTRPSYFFLSQNVVEFSRKGSPPAAAAADAAVISRGAPAPPPAGSLIVSVEAVPNVAAAPIRRMDFVFRRTGVRWGATGSFDLPFAVGRGHFDVLHLDEALRVDRDANGWVNVYAYDGPVTRCTVGE